MEENYNANNQNPDGREPQPGPEQRGTPHTPQNYGPQPGDRPYGWGPDPQPPRQPYYGGPEQERQARGQYSASGGWQDGAGDAPPRKEPYQWRFEDYQQAAAARPKRHNKGLIVFCIVLAVVLTLSLLSVAGVSIYHAMSREKGGASQAEPSLNVPAGDLPGISLKDKPQVDATPSVDGKLSTEEIVERVEPSIVAITTYVNTGTYQAEGMGSGIVISEDGYIATNAHVVKDALGITVTMSDGATKYEGRVIGSDQKTDLAVIKVDATGLQPAEFGNSDQVKVGEKVIAIGNPQSMEFAGSVTQGIVSGLNRQLTASDSSGSAATTYSKLIQTDAAINPGNSGGALVNEFGQVIGINSAKVITTGSEGMGFAIPSSSAQPIIDDLIAHGRVTGRALLGVTVYMVDISSARLNGVPVGLLVQTTQPESDVSKKGIVPGDILTKADGVPLDSTQALSKVIEEKKPGDTIELEVYRPASRSSVSGRSFTVTVALMEDMGNTAAVPSGNQNPGAGNAPNGGDYPGYKEPGNDGGSGRDPYEDFEDFFNKFFG